MYNSLQEQVQADSGEVNKQLTATFYYLNGVGDAIETISFTDDSDILDYLTTTLGRYDMIPTGAYLLLADSTYLDPSGWDPGYDYTTADWYQTAVSYDDRYYHYYDEPYFDGDTGALCATVTRHVHLADGREGALAADLMMATSQEYLNSTSVFDTGHAMMATNSGLILSYVDESVAGQNIADVTDDKLLQSIAVLLTQEEGNVQVIRGQDGNYYAIAQTVTGTDWKVVAYARQMDVLRKI